MGLVLQRGIGVALVVMASWTGVFPVYAQWYSTAQAVATTAYGGEFVGHACSAPTSAGNVGGACTPIASNPSYTASYSRDTNSGYAKAEVASIDNTNSTKLGTLYAHALAISDIATGSLHANNFQSFGNSDYLSSSNATASFFDTLTFQSSSSNLFNVGFHVHIDGTFGDGDQTFFSFYAMPQNAGNGLQGSIRFNAPQGEAQTVASSGAVPTLAGNWITRGPGDFYGIFTVVPGSTQWSIGESLTIQGGTNDFSNTATLGLDLPSGVTFTSASNLFLTAPTFVPEPRVWAMMVAGFGVVGATTRRRGGKPNIA